MGTVREREHWQRNLPKRMQSRTTCLADLLWAYPSLIEEGERNDKQTSRVNITVGIDRVIKLPEVVDFNIESRRLHCAQAKDEAQLLKLALGILEIVQKAIN